MFFEYGSGVSKSTQINKSVSGVAPRVEKSEIKRVFTLPDRKGGENVAKDGINRVRAGAGRKPKPFIEKINEGRTDA